MSVNIFFIDEHNSSKQNGIGTFRDLFFSLLSKEQDLQLTLLSLNSDVIDLTVNNHPFGVEYAVPFVAKGNWRDYGDLIWSVIHIYIKDSSKNVFFLNHSPCREFIDSLKKFYPKSRIIFIIHDQGWCAPLFGDSELLASIEIGKRPDIVSESTMEYVKNYCSKEMEIYDKVDKVVCLSDSTEIILKEIYHTPADKISKIRNGCPIRHGRLYSRKIARSRLCLRNDDIVLIFVARPARHKGIEPLLMALKKIRMTYNNIRCVLVGSAIGFMSYLETEKNIASSLIYTGQLSKEELMLWYVAADIGILPSYSEQCSFAALEMMQHGLTIVSSDGHGVRDMFKNYENAFTAKITNVLKKDDYANNLAQAISKAINIDSSTKSNFYRKNIELLNTVFSAEKMASEYKNLILEVVNR